MTQPNTGPQDGVAATDSESLGDLVRNLFSLWGAIRRHIFSVIFVAAAAIVATGAWTLRQPKVYRATATVLINSRPPVTLDKVSDVVSPDYYADAERFVNAQVRLLTSRDMAERVARRAKVPAESLVGRLEVLVDKSSQVAALSVEDLDPATAQKLANAFKDEYIDFSIADRSSVSADSARFLEDQAQKLRTQLESDEKALYDFQRINELPGSNFEESHKIQSSNLGALHLQHAQARATGIRLRSELEQIDGARGDRALLRVLTFSDTGERWTALRDKHMVLSEQLSALQVRYGERHPKVAETREALTSIDRDLDHEVDLQIAALRARERANQREQQQLSAAIAGETRRAVALRQGELQYNTLKRRRDEDKDTYELVARRLKETQLQTLVHQSYVRPVDAAVLPQEPVRPLLVRNLLVGTLFGLALGVGLAFLLEMVDDTVRTPADAERAISEPLLGVIMAIPVPPTTPNDDPAVEVVRAEHIVKFPRSRIAEQCHVASTNLYSMFLHQPPRALMVTSATVDDGKTLVSVNLASTVAARGKRVLLVDADLRRGRLHRLFQLPRGGGLFELLTQRITAQEAIRRTWIPNVDVITNGDVPEKVSPIRILELPELAQVIKALAERYDLVLFDTAPVTLVADAQIVGMHVDGVIGVVRAGKTSRRLARGLAQQLAMARANLVGWILNDVSESALKAGYYYGYGYGRHDYQGYYNAEPPASG
jgi:capsular exopolysaccharide synthesis family protein